VGVIKTIGLAIQIVRFVLAEKRKLEANTAAYLSVQRADRVRLILETLCQTLEDGEANPNWLQLPRGVQWLCRGTRIDEYIGAFGRRVLKSGKLATNDPVLRQDLSRFSGDHQP
jgi:hypothetical protein